jgi:hypothetical protein
MEEERGKILPRGAIEVALGKRNTKIIYTISSISTSGEQEKKKA